MKNFLKIRKAHIFAALVLPAMCFETVEASTVLSRGTVGLTVSNTSADVNVSNAWFEQGIVDGGMQFGDGVGAANVIWPDALPAISGATYSFMPMVVNATVSNGQILNSIYAGWINLKFTNSSTSVVSVDLSMSYNLISNVSGEYADSESKLEYYLNDAFPSMERAYASVFDVSSSAANGIKLLTLDLNPGVNVFHADLMLSNSLQATAPVPLPAAVWSFFAGLMGILGLKKRKQRPAENV